MELFKAGQGSKLQSYLFLDIYIAVILNTFCSSLQSFSAASFVNFNSMSPCRRVHFCLLCWSISVDGFKNVLNKFKEKKVLILNNHNHLWTFFFLYVNVFL